MAAWSWLRHAPWGDIARAAARRVPDLVRDLRGAPPAEPPPGPRPAAEAGTGAPTSDLADLRFRLELLEAGLDKLRSQAETQARLADERTRELSAAVESLAARARVATWVACAGLVLAAVVAALPWLR